MAANDMEIRERSRRSYLTFEAREDNTSVTWTHAGATTSFMWPIQVSTDGGTTWAEVAPTTEGATLATINKGQKIIVRRDSAYGFMGSNALYNYFGSDKDVYVYGNIMSLIWGDNFISHSDLRGRYQFGKLFYGMSTLLTDPKLGLIILPATGNHVTYPYAYDEMFNGCAKMTIEAVMPEGLVLGTQTCYGMYWRCSALRRAHLKFSVIGSYGCASMFTLSGLEEIIIEDAALSDYGLRMALRLCPDLKKVTSLLTDISATNCLQNWMSIVAASGTFIKPSSVIYPSGASGIPAGWTVQNLV